MERLGYFMMLLPVIIMAIIFNVLFVRSIVNTFKEIKPENRKMSVSTVWLLLIPLVNVIVQFLVTINLYESIAQEFRDRGVAYNGKPTYYSGMVFSCCQVCAFYHPIGQYTKYLWWVFLFVYWAQVVQQKRKLQETKPILE